MRPPLAHRREATPIALAMTPMIDVVFLLLVFFLVTASFQKPEEDLAASLLVETQPGTGSAIDALPELDEVVVAGRVDGDAVAWSVSGSPDVNTGGLATLLREFAAIDRALPVTIDAGPAVTLGDTVGAYDAARAAGFVEVRLAASADALAREPSP